jgi:hypothetical protein
VAAEAAEGLKQSAGMSIAVSSTYCTAVASGAKGEEALQE